MRDPVLWALVGLILQGFSLGHGGEDAGPGLPSEWSASPPAPLQEASEPTPPQVAGRPPVNRGAQEDERRRRHWDHWWLASRSQYLSPRRQRALRPSPAQVRDEVMPALIEVLADGKTPEVLSAVLIALAKMGASYPDGTELVPVLTELLRFEASVVSEAAALSLGILGDEVALPLLAALLRDEPRGREAVGGEAVPTRTRAFAAYGLGLLAHRTDDDAVRRQVARHLVDILEQPGFDAPDIPVGAMNALGLVRLEWVARETSPPPRPELADRPALIRYLAGYLARTDERAQLAPQLVRAHAPISLARLMDDPRRPSGRKIDDLQRDVALSLLEMTAADAGENRLTQQSALIALGLLGNASSATGDDDWRGRLNDRIRVRLIEVATNSRDLQCAAFALVALARSGSRPGFGPAARGGEDETCSALLACLASSKGSKRPWASLALGVFGHSSMAQGRRVPDEVRAALRDELRGDKTPMTAGAHAIALALLDDGGSADLLAEKLDTFKGANVTRGYLALGLGLLRARDALPAIRALIEEGPRGSALLRSAATSLALLGDHESVPRLVDRLRTSAEPSALAAAIGAFGDPRSIEPLLELLRDPTHASTTRAFAAVALGLVCDEASAPWNAPYAIDGNYRASTPTLRNPQGTGILDIL